MAQPVLPLPDELDCRWARRRRSGIILGLVLGGRWLMGSGAGLKGNNRANMGRLPKTATAASCRLSLLRPRPAFLGLSVSIGIARRRTVLGLGDGLAGFRRAGKHPAERLSMSALPPSVLS